MIHFCESLSVLIYEQNIIFAQKKVSLDISLHIKKLSELIDRSDKIVLVCHINPDGDAIGSMLAFYHFLISRGKKADMISPNYLQDFLLWMDGTSQIEIFIKRRKRCVQLINEADLIIMLDFNQPDRLGEAEKHVVNSKATKIIVDHHIDPFNFYDYLISDTSRCATAELIYDLVAGLEGKPFNNILFCEAIYVGIITDTGSFDFGSFVGHTLRIVAQLLDVGVDKEKVRIMIFNNFSADRMRLMGFALDQKMVILDEFETAYIYLSKEDLLKYNHVKGDTEGFVNLPLEIKNIRFSVLFMEKSDLIKLSFRSKGDFPVNEFASRYYGGGGHKNAAGGEVKGNMLDAIDSFLSYIKEDNPVKRTL